MIVRLTTRCSAAGLRARPGNSPAILARLRQDFASAFDRIVGSPAAAALRREPLLLQPLSLRRGAAQPRAPPASRRFGQLLPRAHRWRTTSERLYDFLGVARRAVAPSTWRASGAGSFCASCCATCWVSPRSPTSPRNSPTWPTPSSTWPTAASAPSSWRATASRAWPMARLCGFSRHLARQAGRQGAELQLRYRPDVRLRRQWRNRRARAASPTRNSTRRSPTSTPPCSPPTPPRASATAWTCACGPMAPWARSASPTKAPALTTASARATGKSRC